METTSDNLETGGGGITYYIHKISGVQKSQMYVQALSVQYSVTFLATFTRVGVA